MPTEKQAHASWTPVFLCLLGLLAFSCTPASASGGKKMKESELATAPLEAVRRPAPFIDRVDTALAASAIPAGPDAEDTLFERRPEPLITALEAALVPDAPPKKEEGGAIPEFTYERRPDALVPRPLTEDEMGDAPPKKEEGEVPDVVLFRHREAVVDGLSAALDRGRARRGKGSDGEGPEVELSRQSAPVVDRLSVAVSRASTRKRPQGEGDEESGFVVERRADPEINYDARVQTRIRKMAQLTGGQGEDEREFTRHPLAVVDDTENALVEAGSQGEGEGQEVSFARKPGAWVDHVDAAVSKSPHKSSSEGEDGGRVDYSRLSQPRAPASPIPGLKELAEPPPEEASPSPAPATPERPEAVQRSSSPPSRAGRRTRQQPAPVDPWADRAPELARRFPQRDLSRPATRIVGHWSYRMGNACGDYWFGPPDARTGIGTFVVRDQGSLRRGTWRLVREDAQEQTVTVSSRLLPSDPMTYPVPRHGATLMEVYSPRSALMFQFVGPEASPGTKG